MPRIASILVADFPVAAIVRANPELRDRPVALSASREGHAELSAVSACARAAGVRTGMTIAQARALLSGLIIAAPSPAAECSAHDALLDAAQSFSPLVEDGGPGCAYLDLAGLAKIHGPEEQMAAELARRVAKVGIGAAIGIASNKEVACLAARCGGQRVIPAALEREFLDWMPLDVLDLGDNGSDRAGLEFTLARWGIRRLGELARIDLRALGSRLGARGVALARLARGENEAPFVSRPRTELFAETVELDYGIEMLEPASFVMRPMIERLAARLELRGLVAGDLMLSLGLDGHGVDDRRVTIAAPTNDIRSILALIILSLEAAPPAAAIESIRITVSPRVPRPAQADLFLPPTPAPDRLQTTIARLAALCGPDRVGTLSAVNSHRPEAIEVAPFDPPPPAASLRDQKSSAQLCGKENRSALIPRGVYPERSRRARDDKQNQGAFAVIPSVGCRSEESTRSDLSECPITQRSPDQGEGNIARLVIRAIRPAEEIEVMCTRGGLPEFVRGRTVCARVVSISGPWRRQGEWWLDEASSPTPPPFARDYYDVALADGAVYRMFCDLRANHWYMDGLYD